jgi:O-acetyl-ADP-ribose deacetylase (regulator of RNase III)
MIEHIWLVHPQQEMCDAFQDRFKGLPNVKIIQDRFENLDPHDCFVTAGNSYGMMTAGIDAVVVNRFGEQIMERVQHHIMDKYFGEQPIGTSFVLATNDPHIPFLAHSPTMRTPENIEGTDKIYLATFAAFLSIQAHNQSVRGTTSEQFIETVALPAMGTGFGRVPFSEAARQMAVAYRHFLEPPHRMDWDTVVERELAICYDDKKRVVK